MRFPAPLLRHRAPVAAALVVAVAGGAWAATARTRAPAAEAPPAPPPAVAAPADPAPVPAAAEFDFDDSSRQTQPDSALSAPRDVPALIASFRRELDRLQRARSLEARIGGYRQTLQLLDQILLDEPGFAFEPGLQSLVVSYIDALNEQRAGLSGSEHERNLSEARAIALRIDDTPTRVRKLLDIAQVEATAATPEQTLATIYSVLREGERLAGADRDGALLRIIAITAPMGVDGRTKAALWLPDIRDAGARAEGLRLISQAAVAADPLLTELIASPQLGGDREERLLDISSYMARERRYDAATWTAALVSDRLARERDEALEFVVEYMMDEKADIDSMITVHGIGDPHTRNRVLLDLSDWTLERDRLAEARRFAGFMSPALESVLAWTRIGAWLADKDYRSQAAAAAATASALLAQLPDQHSERRDAVLSNLGRLYAGVQDRDQARRLARRIDDEAAADEIHYALLDSAIELGQLEQAQDDLASLETAALRDRGSARCAEELAKAYRYDEALALAQRIESPLPRMDALLAIIKPLARATPGKLGAAAPLQARIPQLAAEVLALGARIPLGAGQNEAAALSAVAKAQLGDFQGARAQLDLALSAQRYKDALSEVVSLQARREGADSALQTARLSYDRNARVRAEGGIAADLVRQDRLEEAVAAARRIEDDRSRVSALRDIAEAAAKQVDDHDLLRVTTGRGGPIKRKYDAGMPLTAVNGKEVFKLPNGDLGEWMPAVPAHQLVGPEAVAADLPAVAPGRIHVIPLHYSDFNQKFLASLSYFFNDYGGKLFYFDAQKTAFPVFISLDGGVFDLPSIAHYLRETGQSQYLTREGRRYRLQIPLLIGPSATLVINGTDVDELRLVRDSGVYIVNAGRLHVYNTRITGWDERLQKPAELTNETKGNFRPFIVNWSGSKTDMAKSTISHLGFAGGKGYGLAFSAGPDVLLKNQPLGLPRPTGRLVDNSFQNMLYGLYTYETDDLVVVGNEYKDNLVYGIDPHDRSRRLLIAYNTAYGTKVKHGIIVSREVDDSWIVGNVSFDNVGTGVMLDRNSKGNLVYANSAFDNRQEGIAVYESPCNIVAFNQVLRNRRDGIKLRNSWDIGVFGNLVMQNQGVAIKSYTADVAAVSAGHERDFELDPYTKFADVALIDNTLHGNAGGGVSLRNVSSLIWKKNALVSQVKPVKGTMEDLMTDLVGRSDEGLLARASCAPPPVEYTCSFKTRGYLAGQGIYRGTPGLQSPICDGAAPPARTADAAGVLPGAAAPVRN